MSTGLIIDIAVIIIVALCAWSGFKNGIIRGVCGILAIILALYGASIAAKMYSNEFVSMFRPFVGGMLDTSVSNSINGRYVEDEQGRQIEDPTVIRAEDNSSVYDVSFAALRNIGLSENAAQKMAEDVKAGVSAVDRDMSAYLTKLVCERISYVCVFMLAFIILAVALAIIGNAIDIVFTLPGLGLADSIGGVVFGIVKGILIVMAIAMFLRYTGLLLKDHMVEDSFIISKLLNNNPVANIIGI